jgi:hypothetical protein
MDPMTKMASALSDGPEELEETFESMTIDQLDEFVKNGGEGSFIGQLALSQQNEWEEKCAMAVQMGSEMAQKEKTAVFDQLLGGAVGHHYGTEQKKRGEKYEFGVPQAAGALFLPGGAGYQIGRYMAHHDENIKRGKKGKEKKSSMEKTAAPMLGALKTGMQGLAGRGMHGAISSSRNALTGGGAMVGAGLGAARGALGNPGVDPNTGQQKSRLGYMAKNIAGGAALGAGAGYAAKPLAMRAAGTTGRIGEMSRDAMATGIRGGGKGMQDMKRVAGFENLAARKAAKAAVPAAAGATGAAAPAAAAVARPSALNPAAAAAKGEAARNTMAQETGVRGWINKGKRALGMQMRPDPGALTAAKQVVSSVDFSKLASDFMKRTW